MNETKDYYSPDEVAELLNLHVRTVRRFIHEGRLKAVQVGKQYRIAARELDALVGARRGTEGAAQPNRRRRIVVSTTVDVDGIGPGEQERLVALLLGAFQSLQGQQSSRRLDSVYYADEQRLRLLLNADLDTTNAVLGMLRGLLEDGGEMGGRE